jgi:hypothetical protein
MREYDVDVAGYGTLAGNALADVATSHQQETSCQRRMLDATRVTGLILAGLNLGVVLAFLTTTVLFLFKNFN